MAELYKRELYGETMALQIETMGTTAISIANRWALGWEGRVMELLISKQYLQKLTEQTSLEKDILANETALEHLSPREILDHHQVPQQPPEVTPHS